MSMNIGTDLSYRMYGGFDTAYGRTDTGDNVKSGNLTGQQKTEENLIAKTECQTCKNRKYQDVSSDPGVSFKSAQSLSPEQASSAVVNHEYEHVSHDRVNAEREGRRVVSQNVQIFTSICPECGRTYVSGGLTTTTTAKAADNYKSVANLGQNQSTGSVMDMAA